MIPAILFILALIIMVGIAFANLKKSETESDKRYAIDKSWDMQERELRQSDTMPEEITDIADLNFSNNFKRKSIIKRVKI